MLCIQMAILFTANMPAYAVHCGTLALTLKFDLQMVAASTMSCP